MVSVFAIAAIILLVSCTLGCYFWIKVKATGKIFSDPRDLRRRPTALVLGTARFTSRGGENLYFSGRIAAAALLYQEGGAGQLVLSGADRQPVALTEAEAMAMALRARGVPEGALVRDERGYRTWDSLWICLHVFGCRNPIVVSQRFHVERALFIGKHLGMEPVGFAAPAVRGPVAARMFARECLARVKCIADCFILHPRPVYQRKGQMR